MRRLLGYHGQVIQLLVLTLLCRAQDPPAGDEKAAEPDWAFSAQAYAYFIPGERDYVQPTFIADRDGLHLEARYNYEDHGTGSVWVGRNFSVGDTLKFDLTPMMGGVFGKTAGIAPGYRASLTYWKLELSSEGEYVFDTGDHDDSFFYTWSELTIAPADWLSFGLVVQRTKVFETAFDTQRGLLARFTFDPVEIAGYVFNPNDRPVVVVSIALNF